MKTLNLSKVRCCRRHYRTPMEFVGLQDNGLQAWRCPKCKQVQLGLVLPDDVYQESLLGGEGDENELP